MKHKPKTEHCLCDACCGHRFDPHNLAFGGILLMMLFVAILIVWEMVWTILGSNQ